MRGQFLTGTAMLLAIASVASSAQAGPTGGSAGSNVTIVQDGTTTTIHQTSQNAIIDWQSFDVGRDETVHFDQPGRDSATLNRVVAGNESTIAGTITAPGTVIIYNTNGVIFTDSAQIDVGSLVATSIPISETDFNAGRLHFEGSAAPGAIVSNAGSITVGDKGLAALVGSRVANSGTITARLGTVALAAGDMVTLDLAGDGLFNIAVGKMSSATGGTLVDQSGTIVADGGRVVLSAEAAAGVVDSAINLSGVVRAHGLESGAGGSVLLSGGSSGAVRVSGTIDVASTASTGGTAVVTGSTVTLAPTARIDATGATGGGEVRVGGGFQGRDPAVLNALDTQVAAGAVIDASATVQGNGGGIVVWANDKATVDGSFLARGAGTGAGGFVETSGKGELAVGIGTVVDTGAAAGAAGTWLLDPTSITIQTGGSAGSIGAANGAAGASTIDPSVIVAALGTGNVLLVADDLITVDADIVATNAQLNGHSLGLVTAVAGSNIQVNKSIVLDDLTGTGGMVLQSQGDIHLGKDAVLFADAGTIWLESVGAVGDIVQDVSAGYTGAVIADSVVAKGRLVSLGSSYNFAEKVAGTAIGSFDAATATTTGGTFTFAGSNASGTAPAYGAGVSIVNPLSGAIATDVVARVRQRIDTLSVTALGDGDGRTTFTVGGAGNTEYFDEIILTPTWMYYPDPSTGQLVPYDQLFADNDAWLNAIPLREASDFLIASTSYVTSGGTDSGTIVAANYPDVSVLAPGLSVSAVSGTLKTDSGWGGDPKTWGVTGTIGDDRFGFYGADSIDEVTFNYRTGQAEKMSFQYAGDTKSATFETRNFYSNDSSVTATLPLPGGGTYTGPLVEGLTAEAYRTVDGTVSIGATAQAAQASVGDVSVVYGNALPGYDGTGVTGLNAADAKIQALLPGAIYHDVSVVADALGAFPDVGSYTDALTLSYGAGSYFGARYDTTVDPGSLTVTPRAITIDIGDATKIYGDANPGWVSGGAQSAVVDGAAQTHFSITDGSIASIDSTGGKGIAINANTAATTSSGVGSYDITNGGVSAVGGLKLSNYTVTVTNGSLNVTPADLVVTIGDKSRTYGDAPGAYTYDISGYKAGDDEGDLGGSLAFAGDPGQAANAGFYNDILTGSGLTSSNYNISYVAGDLTIDKALLTVTVGDQTRSYGDAPLPYTDAITGFVLGQNAGTAAGFGGSLVVTGDPGQSTHAGIYADTLNGATSTYTATNYGFQYVAGDLTVNKRAVTIDIGNDTRVYGDANPAWIAGGAQNAVVNGSAQTHFSITDGSIAGIDSTGGKGIAIDANTLATTASGVGSYDITNGGLSAIGGLDLTNYDVTVTNGSLDVTKRAITIDIADAHRTYGDNNPAWISGGLQTAVENGAAAINFSITNGSLASVDVGASKGIAIDANTTATNTTAVGGYAITAGTVTSIGGVDLNNYDVTVTDGTLTIDKRALEITVGNDSRIYGDANPAWIASGQSAIVNGTAQTHYSVTGGSFASFDQTDADISLNVSTTAGAASGVGSYGIAGSVSGSSDIELSNYDVTVKPGTLQVTPRDLTVIIGSDTKIYGDANPAWIDGGSQPSGTAFSVSNLASADGAATLGLDVKTGATVNSGVGNYAITNNGALTGVDLANYTVTYQNGALAVTPASLLVTVGDKTRTYGDAPGGYTYGITGYKAGDDEGDLGGSLAFAGDPGQTANAGFYDEALSGSGLTSSNYTISYENGDLTINKALLTVTVANQSRSYGDAPLPYADDITGFVLGQTEQTAAGFGGTLVVTGDPGQSAGAGFYNDTLNGSTSTYAATNYDFQYVAGDLTIDKRAIVVAIGSDTKIYGDANPAWIDGGSQPSGMAFSVSNIASIDSGATLGLDVQTGATVNSNVGNYAISNNGALTGLDLANYDVTYQNGNLAVTPASLLVTVGDKTRTYGSVPGGYTYGITGYKAGDDEGDLGGSLAFAGDPGQSADAGFYDEALGASGLTSSNYTISYENGDLTINKALLTVTVADQTRTYGGAPKPYADAITGFVLGQTRQTAAGFGGTLTVAGDPGQAANAGFYDNVLDGSNSSYTAKNYDFQYVAGDLTIDRAPLVVTVIGGTRGVGQPNPPFHNTIDGFVLGQGPSVLGGQIVYTTPANQQSLPGNYPVDGSGYTAANYTISYVPGTLQVVGVFYGNNGISDGFIDPYVIGRDPDTPGDAVYRTTRFENPFIQDAYVRAYSLGVVNTGVAGVPTDAAGLAALAPAAGPGAIATTAPGGFKTDGQFIDRGVVVGSDGTPVALPTDAEGGSDASSLAALEPSAGPDAKAEGCGIGATFTDYWACKIPAGQ